MDEPRKQAARDPSGRLFCLNRSSKRIHPGAVIVDQHLGAADLLAFLDASRGDGKGRLGRPASAPGGLPVD